MTHNIHPHLHRIGITKEWRSDWFSDKPARYRDRLMQDHTVRKTLDANLIDKSVADTRIERQENKYIITISTSRPGLVIGRNGELISDLTTQVKKALAKMGVRDMEVELKVEEVRFSEVSAHIVAEGIVGALKKRLPFRRVMKQALERVMANRYVLGARIELSGRLGGAEMSRKEHIRRGRVPLQTLRANIDYANETALLPYGSIGVKVYIYYEEESSYASS